ncbi:MAG: GNAT family N-acetyltransferase [Gammaproteobacteria bacterium]|nr:GNAT family N-acetyltransferase [Gammaproteobacteria bacterium]
MPSTIRRARPEDAAAIAHAEYATAAAQQDLLVARPHEIPVQVFRDTITGLEHNGLYVVLEEDGQLLGHLLLQPMDLAALRHVVTLTIVVHPGHTGRGHGRRLLAHAIDWATRQREIEKIELRVRATNSRARQLYESLGFTVEGVMKERIRLTDGYVDDIAMGRFVRSTGV